MAKILLVQCNRLVSGVQYSGIASLFSSAKRAGHEVVFFDTACYSSQPAASLEYKDRESRIDLEFRQIKNRDHLPQKMPISVLLDDLERVIKDSAPDLIGFSVFSDDWPFALFLIKKVRSVVSGLPIIVGGIHASLMPEQVIAHPEVDMVCVGEGEGALVELLDRIALGGDRTSIGNLWVKHRGALRKNPVRPLVSFDDATPIPDWTHYTDIHHYYPFEGRLYRRGSVSLGRGCPYACSFCINDAFKRMYSGSSARLRIKGVQHVVRELTYLKDIHRLEFFRFWDETFLAMPAGYLEEFAKAYKKEIALPFTIETTAQTITKENARMLVEMGCQSVSVGIETSNEKLRMGILNKSTSNRAYAACFAILTNFGIRKVGNFMFFLPHQTIDDMWNDVRVSADWKIDHASARIFYPYVGTSLREYCLSKDMVDCAMLKELEDENGVKSISDLSRSYVTFRDTVLKVDPAVRKAGRLILDNFVLFQETEPARHGWLKDLLGTTGADAVRRVRAFEREVYKKRFGEEFFARHE